MKNLKSLRRWHCLERRVTRPRNIMFGILGLFTVLYLLNFKKHIPFLNENKGELHESSEELLSLEKSLQDVKVSVERIDGRLEYYDTPLVAILDDFKELLILGLLVFIWEGLHHRRSSQDQKREAMIRFISSLNIFIEVVPKKDGKLVYRGLQTTTWKRLKNAIDGNYSEFKTNGHKNISLVDIGENEYLFYNLGTLNADIRQCASALDQTEKLHVVLNQLLYIETLNDRYGYIVDHMKGCSAAEKRKRIEMVTKRISIKLKTLRKSLGDLFMEWEPVIQVDPEFSHPAVDENKKAA